MMRGDQDLPDAWRDATEDDDPKSRRELAGMLPEVLPRSGASGLTRLLDAVSQVPLRYAPFLDRVAALWDVSAEQANAVFSQSKTLAGWKRTPLPGVRVIAVSGGPRTSGAETFLVRFAPGTRFPRHRHPGHESLLVLEGSYADTNGRVVGPGDLHEMEPGSEHGFLVDKDGPCIGAVVQRGREFTGLLMRILAFLLDRKASNSSL